MNRKISAAGKAPVLLTVLVTFAMERNAEVQVEASKKEPRLRGPVRVPQASVTGRAVGQVSPAV